MNTVDKVAKAIYESQREEIELTGQRFRIWRISDAQWDQHTDIELCEWERDEYRTMTRAAIKAININ